MGQTLSNPDVQKHKKSGGNEKFAYALCEMQGWRTSMEDAHAIELTLDGKDETNAFFAVYDGHGGNTVAKYCGANLHKRLISEEMYKDGKDYLRALKDAFLGTDEDIRAGEFWDPSGCTAVAALVTHDGILYVANAGDSRAVLCVKGEVKPLSFDHKPNNDTEWERIRSAGGYLEYGRVNGNLALSRAIGDFEFKKNPSLRPERQLITADPDLTTTKLEEDHEFLIIACDGIWDCLSSQQATDIVRLKVSEGMELDEIASFLCDHCLAPDTTSGAGLGCDNMTVLIVALLNGRTKEEWYAWITDRVKNNYGYPTPAEVPSLYAAARLEAFKYRKIELDAMASRRNGGMNSFNDSGDDYGLSSVFGGRAMGAGGPLGFARSMLGTGMQFHPASTTLDDSDEEEVDSEDEEEDMVLTLPDGDDKEKEEEFFRGLGMRTPVGDITKSLKAQLDELEDTESPISSEPRDEEMSNPGDEALQAFGARAEGSSASSSDSKTETTTTNGMSAKTTDGGEAPPPPAPLVKGDLKVQQLESAPGGDEAAPAVKAEGLMDKSESIVETN